MKRFIAVCLSMSMLITAAHSLPVSAESLPVKELIEDENENTEIYDILENDMFRYHIKDGNIIIDGCSDNANKPKAIVIPSEIDDMPVTEIGKTAFALSSIESVTFPDSLQKIEESAFFANTSIKEVILPEGVVLGKGAFIGCRELETLHLPDTMTEIPEKAFAYCSSLKSIDIPKNVKIIGESAFSGCASLTSIEIPDSITSIASKAFMKCTNLKSLTIPDSVTEIGEKAFYECENLVLYQAHDSYPAQYARENGIMCLNIGEIEPAKEILRFHIFDGKINIDGFTEEYQDSEVVEIPSYIYGIPVEQISWEAFKDCKNLKSVILPDTLLYINDYAFSGCSSLEEITLPVNFKYGAENTFEKCWSLKKIIFAEGRTEINDFAMPVMLDNLEVVLPESLQIIGNRVFDGWETLSRINIPDGVAEIGERAFFNCKNLHEITLPDSMKLLGADAFGGCDNLETINMPYDMKIIGNPFRYSKFGEEQLKNSTEWIYNGYLISVYSNEEKYVIPDGVHTICSDSFYDCGKVREITIPSGVKIASGAFSYSPLRKVNLPDTLTEIPEMAFFSCDNIRSVKIPQSVTRIEKAAFGGCNNLEEIVIPENITYIGESAFWACNNLEEMVIPGNVRKIDDNAFAYCPRLKSVKFMNGVEELGSKLFDRSTELLYVEIPPSVKTMGVWMFECADKAVILGESGSYAEEYAKNNHIAFIDLKTEFEYNEETPADLFIYRIIDDGIEIINFTGNDITELVIPEYIEGMPVTRIGNAAFRYHKSLTKVIIPDSVTYIGECAFCNCDNIRLIRLPAKLEEIDYDGLYTHGYSLIVLVEEGGYAEEYAKEHLIRYEITEPKENVITTTTNISTTTTSTESTNATMTETTTSSVSTEQQTTSLPQTGTNGNDRKKWAYTAFITMITGAFLMIYGLHRKEKGI